MHIFVMALFLLGLGTISPDNAPKTIQTPAPPFQIIGSPYAFSTPDPIPHGLNVNGPQSRLLPSEPKGQFTSVIGSSANGGIVGYGFQNYHDIVGIYMNNSLYPDLTLTQSTNTQGNTLYAPTTKATDDGCLEVNTFYSIDQLNVQNRGVRIFDFCYAGFDTTFNFNANDSTFQEKYLRDFGQGMMYTAEVISAPHVWSLKSPRRYANYVSSWRALLYNYQSNQWDLLWTTAPGVNEYNGGGGWDEFETHYEPGPCPVLNHTIYSNLLVSTDTINWGPTSTQDLYYGIPYGDCFVDPAGYNPSNTMTYESLFNGTPYTSWAVSSNPTVGATPTCPSGVTHCGYPGQTITFNFTDPVNVPPIYLFISSNAPGATYNVSPFPTSGTSPNAATLSIITTYGVTPPGRYTLSAIESSSADESNPTSPATAQFSVCNLSTQTCP